MAGQVGFVADLGTAYPERVGELSAEMRMGLEGAMSRYNLEKAASIESYRRELNEAMADLFAQADFVMCSANPDVAFAAEGPPPSDHPRSRSDSRDRVHPGHHEQRRSHRAVQPQREPAMSLPAGLVDDLPVGLQVLAGHHREQLLLDLALVAERALPWPKVAPGSPHRV